MLNKLKDEGLLVVMVGDGLNDGFFFVVVYVFFLLGIVVDVS